MMTDTRLREAAQAAVEAFDRFYGDYGDSLAAIDRLRAALDAPAAPLDEERLAWALLHNVERLRAHEWASNPRALAHAIATAYREDKA